MGYEGQLTTTSFQKGMLSPQWKFLMHTLQQCLSQKRTAWNEIGSTLASAMVCLVTNQLFNFSKLIFEGMLWNIAHPEQKILMYPRFLQHILSNEISNLSNTVELLLIKSHTRKVFANMRRMNKGFSGHVTPLFSTMMGVPPSSGEGPSNPLESHPPPLSPALTVSTAEEPLVSSAVPSIAVPQTTAPVRQPSPVVKQMKPRKKTKSVPSTLVSTPIPTPIILSSSPQEVLPEETVLRETIELSPKLQKVVSKERDDHIGRALSTDGPLSGSQDRLNITKTQPMATPDDDVVSLETTLEGGPRCQETTGEGTASARQEISSNSKDPSPVGTQRGRGEDSKYWYTPMELMEYCAKLQEQVNDQGEEIKMLKRVVLRLVQKKKLKKFKLQPRRVPSMKKNVKSIGTSPPNSSSSSSSEEDATNKGENETGDETGERMDVDEEGEKEVSSQRKETETETVVTEIEKVAEIEGEKAEPKGEKKEKRMKKKLRLNDKTRQMEEYEVTDSDQSLNEEEAQEVDMFFEDWDDVRKNELKKGGEAVGNQDKEAEQVFEHVEVQTQATEPTSNPTSEEQTLAAELLKLKMQKEIQKRKRDQAKRPKEKGISIPTPTIDKDRVVENVDYIVDPTAPHGVVPIIPPDTRLNASKPTLFIGGQRVSSDDPQVKGKGKKIAVEPVKVKKTPQQLQLEIDERAALELASETINITSDMTVAREVHAELQQRELERIAQIEKETRELIEIQERDMREVWLLEKEERSKKKKKEVYKRNTVNQQQKLKTDKEKFVKYLKERGVSGKSLGPMSLKNVLNLYEAERKKEKEQLRLSDEQKEKERYNFEKLLKKAHEMGATVIDKQGKLISNPFHEQKVIEKEKKTKKSDDRKISKKSKLTSKVTEAEKEAEKIDCSDLIIHPDEEVLHIEQIDVLKKKRENEKRGRR